MVHVSLAMALRSPGLYLHVSYLEKVLIRNQLVNTFIFVYEINMAETKRFIESLNTLLKCQNFQTSEDKS